MSGREMNRQNVMSEAKRQKSRQRDAEKEAGRKGAGPLKCRYGGKKRSENIFRVSERLWRKGRLRVNNWKNEWQLASRWLTPSGYKWSPSRWYAHQCAQRYCMYLGLKSPSGAGRHIETSWQGALCQCALPPLLYLHPGTTLHWIIYSAVRQLFLIVYNHYAS